MIQRFRHLFFCALMVLGVHAVSHAADESIAIERAKLVQCDDGYCLSAKFNFDLHPSLEEAISLGMPLYFTTEVEVKRPRWYWFDARAASVKQSIRISFNVLTRQYRVSVIGSLLRQRFHTLSEALRFVRHPLLWTVAEQGQFETGEKYTVGVRVKLDVSHLPKPFQVHALNSSKWRLSSDWQNFTFTAEK